MGSSRRYQTDVAAIAAAVVTFATGLVLMFAFHVGHGCVRSEAFGLGRLVWQNLHRLGAIVLLTSVALHVVESRAGLWSRLHRVAVGRSKGHDVREVWFCILFMTLVVTGFLALLALAEPQPLYGPPILGPMPPERHRWIDVHNISGLAALVLTYEHVRERWRALVRRGKTGARKSDFTVDIGS